MVTLYQIPPNLGWYFVLGNMLLHKLYDVTGIHYGILPGNYERFGPLPRALVWDPNDSSVSY